MNYDEAMTYLHGTHKFGSKLGLHRIQKLMSLLGNPHKNLKYIHIAGTNGKGSTASFIFNILKEQGFKVGLFTSPYIQRFSERIKVNYTEIPKDDIAKILTLIKEQIEGANYKYHEHPTEFEILTAMALKYYDEQKCDIVVLEVGLGGSIDSTNVIEDSVVSIITTISYDHMNILGNSLEEIAMQKAGIIKQDGNVVVYPQCKEVMQVIENVCKEKNATLYKVNPNYIVEKYSDLQVQIFDYEKLKNMKITLLGNYQILNAAVSIKVIEVLNKLNYTVTENSIRKGLLNTKWPGRLEIVNKEPLFLLDGAHNIQGIDNFVKNINIIFKNKEKIFIIGVLKDKEYEQMIARLAPIAYKFIAISLKSIPRSLPANKLAECIKKYNKDVQVASSVQHAIEMSIQNYSNNKLICVLGSLYYIGEVRTYFGLN